MSVTRRYPRIRVSGNAFERGQQYGSQAKPQILQGRDGYERNFSNSGITWESACATALRYASAIQEQFPEIWQELEGIAAGASLPVEDILAMNCRTEIMWHQANVSASAAGVRGECSSFGLTPERVTLDRLLIGQNWDWLVHSFDSVVLLEVERDDGPNFITVVEAGLLAKFSMNAHGFTLSVNTLATTADFDTSGIPFHVLLRALADSQTTYDAVELLSRVGRASSGNYLVGTPDGAVLNIECEPGGVPGVHVLPAFNGQVTHTNHFVSSLVSLDLAPLALPDSYVRLQRITDLLTRKDRHTIDSLHDILTDHVGAPGSVCCHPDPRANAAQQWSSVCSVIFDPRERDILLCEGIPCETPRETISYRDFLQEAQ